MQLYFSPLACSLATRIALYEAGAPATFTFVDLKKKQLEDGSDYLAINPLGQVPVIRTDAGELLTENGAILKHVAEAYPDAKLVPADRVGRMRLDEWLSYLGTEVHKGIYSLIFSRYTNDALKAYAQSKIPSRFGVLEAHLKDREYLLDSFSIADAYLGTLLNWTRKVGPDLKDWPAVLAYHKRVSARPAVAKAVGEEFALFSKLEA